MADSTVADVSKMKVVDLRKELKSRGLLSTGDKAELVARLQAAISQDDHGDINLDSDEIDSDGVLEDEDDKSQGDILDDNATDTLNEELALADQPSQADTTESKPSRVLKRKITSDSLKSKDGKDEKNSNNKKIVLNRAISVTSVPAQPVKETEMSSEEKKVEENSKVKITADLDSRTKLELRAKRFGLPIKISDADKKEMRKQRFGQSTSNSNKITFENTGTLSENIDKLKKRAERFGQSVSKIMTDIEAKEKLEKRKAKFGAA